jgi:hypothetical protein
MTPQIVVIATQILYYYSIMSRLNVIFAVTRFILN